jgi:hypothetical protein
MAKTYNTLTVANATAGNAILASDAAKVFENVNNYRVPPACIVYRSSTLTGYTSGAAISWNAELIDTDGMFAATSTTITIQTAGIYAITLKGQTGGSATVTEAQWNILVNGSVASKVLTREVASNINTIVTTSFIGSFADSTTIGASVNISGGSAYTVTGSANPMTDWGCTTLSVAWVGQAS